MLNYTTWVAAAAKGATCQLCVPYRSVSRLLCQGWSVSPERKQTLSCWWMGHGVSAAQILEL